MVLVEPRSHFPGKLHGLEPAHVPLRKRRTRLGRWLAPAGRTGHDGVELRLCDLVFSDQEVALAVFVCERAGDVIRPPEIEVRPSVRIFRSQGYLLVLEW